jgi:hypothetical protein
MTALGSLLIILFRCCVILRRRRTIIQNGPGWSPSYRSFLDHRNNEAADQIARLLVSQIQGRRSPNRLRVRGYNCPFRLKSSHIAACADQAHRRRHLMADKKEAAPEVRRLRRSREGKPRHSHYGLSHSEEQFFIFKMATKTLPPPFSPATTTRFNRGFELAPRVRSSKMVMRKRL